MALFAIFASPLNSRNLIVRAEVFLSSLCDPYHGQCPCAHLHRGSYLFACSYRCQSSLDRCGEVSSGFSSFRLRSYAVATYLSNRFNILQRSAQQQDTLPISRQDSYPSNAVVRSHGASPIPTVTVYAYLNSALAEFRRESPVQQHSLQLPRPPPAVL